MAENSNNNNNNLFAGRYKIIQEIGNGGMANVFKAQDTLLNRFVAIKVLKPEFEGDVEFTSRFTTEAQAAAALSHQNLVSIYDVGVADNRNYIVMEFIDGVTLKEYVRRQGMLNWRKAVQITTQILEGIQHAHKRGIVHRDVKPQNIMVTEQGLVKVMDFGIARATSSYTLKIGDATIGSVHYFSPEQARGRHTDEKSDIYSLGIVLYEMLTGHLPFDGDSPIAVAMMHLQTTPRTLKDYNIAIPLALEEIVAKAMRKDTFERYQTAEDFLADLLAVADNPERSPVTDNIRDTSGDTLILPTVSGRIIPSENDFDFLGDAPNDYSPKSRAVRRENERRHKEAKRKRAEAKKHAAQNMGQTKRIGIIDDTANKNAFDNKDNLRSPIKAAKNSRRLNAWLTISIVLLSFSVLVFGAFIIFPNMFLKQDFVPDLVGHNYNEVFAEYQDNKSFTLVDVERRYSNDVEKDYIISQSPTSGKTIRVPAKIELVISNGIKSTVLPDLTGREESAAIATLDDLEIPYDKEYESSLTIAEGLVIKTTPAGGATVQGDEQVTVIVSRGKNGGGAVTVPSVVGLTRDKAKKTLEDAKLTVKLSYANSNDDAVDTVISQTPVKGESVDEFSEISLVISSGPVPTQPPATIPDATNPSNNDDDNNNNTNTTTKTRALNVTVPSAKDETYIKVVTDGNKVIHNEKHLASEGSFQVMLQGIDKVKVDVYYDGVLAKSTEISL